MVETFLGSYRAFSAGPTTAEPTPLKPSPRPDSANHRGQTRHINICQKGRKGAGVKGAGVANCRIFRSAVPSVVVWSILLVSLSGVTKKL